MVCPKPSSKYHLTELETSIFSNPWQNGWKIVTSQRSFVFLGCGSFVVCFLSLLRPPARLSPPYYCNAHLFHGLSQPYSIPLLIIPYYPIHLKYQSSTSTSHGASYKRIARYLSSAHLSSQVHSRASSGTKSTVPGDPLRRRRPPRHPSACWEPKLMYDLYAQGPESFCSYEPVSILASISRGLAFVSRDAGITGQSGILLCPNSTVHFL